MQGHFTLKSNTMMHTIIIFSIINIEIYFNNSNIMDIIIVHIFLLKFYMNHANISMETNNLIFSHNFL